MAQFLNSNVLRQRIIELQEILDELHSRDSIEDKLVFINENKKVRSIYSKLDLSSVLQKNISPELEFVIKSVILLGEEKIFDLPSNLKGCLDKLDKLLHDLLFVENFYRPIGGVIGYHVKLLELLLEQKEVKFFDQKIKYYRPEGKNIDGDSFEDSEAVKIALKNLDKLALLLPIGGAGDRLGLLDDQGVALPAAKLQFLGKTLLEGIIDDIKAMEHLHYKTFGKKVVVPIAMMTSIEKNNDYYIRKICEENNWFGRSKDDFRFFIQPLVPVITEEGHYVLKDNLELLMKPGGHGVIWKLAKDNEIFDWLITCGCSKALVRQVNNPVAGEDNGLLSFIGAGFDKSFGFASCYRVVGMAEGTDILIEKKTNEGYEYSLSNIEYTDFAKRGIKDESKDVGSNYSLFPCNTNILLVDIKEVATLVDKNPFPGLIVNFKSQNEGVLAGRLESLMQNLSDLFILKTNDAIPEGQRDCLNSFITYNKRKKTISVVKNTYQLGIKEYETPESCFYDLMINKCDLLTNYCHMQLPQLSSFEKYLIDGPPFICIYNPILGPLYPIIAKKIRGGKLHLGAELQLNIAEFNMENVDLDGSLLIDAKDVRAKCYVKNVSIVNKGIDYSKNNVFWKNEIQREEYLSIKLHGNAEFHAENVTILGNLKIEVPNGYKFVASQENGKLSFNKLTI